jgi:tRNA(Ile)-lysidine synthase
MKRKICTMIKQYIAKHALITPGSTIILGFSGGPDSVYLLHQLAPLQQELNFTLIAAHLNHGWRVEAQEDVVFCATMAARLNVPFVSAHASDFSSIKKSGSLEQYGRQLRRAFFVQLAQKYAPASVALAHHQDDQIETFFIRLIRGSGLEGLTGMLPKDGCYIRPLLCLNKQAILSELNARNIPFLTDSTNTNTAFLRNSIRLQALPALNACDPRFSTNLLRSMEHLAQADDYIHQETIKTFERISSRQNHLSINYVELMTLHPFLRMRVILYWLCQSQVPFTPSQAFFSEIERFLQQPTDGSHIFYNAWSITKKSNFAYIKLL